VLIDDCIRFLQEFYPNWCYLPDAVVRESLKTYEKSTAIHVDDNSVCGIVLWQDWGDFYLPFLICVRPGHGWWIKRVLTYYASIKPVMWWDEKRFKVHKICHQLQQ